MFLRRKFLLILLVGLFLAPASLRRAFSQSPQDETPPPATGAITGRVLNENGQPLSQATVFVSGNTSLPQQRVSMTDESGNFQITGLDASLYFVRAYAPTYTTVPREPDGLQPTTHRIGDSVTISLMKGGVITGTVTSPGGQPMVQTAVRAIFIRDANGKPPTNFAFALERQTDDRGIYRIYGLAAGTYLVAAGGRVAPNFNPGVNDSDVPTYAPSATRATAAEIEVRAGEETTGVDIRYRGEPGHSISGSVNPTTSQFSATNIVLVQTLNGVSQLTSITYQLPSIKGFSFYGIPDGDYEVAAQFSSGQGELQTSDPLPVKVRGRDVTGLSLNLNALPSLNGRVVLESSTALECKNKRKPLFSETSVAARRSDKNAKVLVAFSIGSLVQTSPDKSGNFLLRNLSPGQFSFDVRFFAKYWYLRRIERDTSVAQPTKAATSERVSDLARNGFQVKLGERPNNVTVTLAEGASSFHGALKLAEGDSPPAKLYVYLVPAEKEASDDVLRFFTTLVQSDGKFGLNNVPPGRYWILSRLSTNNEPLVEAKLRSPDEADARVQLRRDAEANKLELALKPCVNVIDYQLPFRISAGRN